MRRGVDCNGWKRHGKPLNGIHFREGPDKIDIWRPSLPNSRNNAGPIDGLWERHSRQKRRALARLCMRPTILSFRWSFVSSSSTTTTNNCQPPPQLQIRVADFISIQEGPNTSFLELGDLRSCFDASDAFGAKSSSLSPTSLQLLLHNSPSQPTSNSVTVKGFRLS
ncbi:hypothetical protein DL98DRAFT_174194 [Cadophora sp. DSE1049]|nr:hypothetical protein DL98DRAFT_174194 [Cadophora sp. DSE1049]